MKTLDQKYFIFLMNLIANKQDSSDQRKISVILLHFITQLGDFCWPHKLIQVSVQRGSLLKEIVQGYS